MLCESCGNDNRTGSRFCDRCGSPLSLSCPACGESNRGDAAFCASCGNGLKTDARPVGRATPSAERRQVSVLFVDLVGFTAFAEARDPERVRAVQQDYFDAATDVITRHGGSVEKFVGDAVMAVWGTPVAHEDDAQRAVRAGLEILKAVEALGHGLAARGGVVTGQAAVTLGATNQGMVAGDMVNTAARLQAAATPREVLVDRATMQAADAVIAFEPVDDLELKGKAGPIRAWRALRVHQARTGDLVQASFVGRVEELRRLKELLHATARDRRIRLVSIVGPAGVGKTRLVEELDSYARGLAETTYWHTGRSPSYGEGLAFWALGEMVRRRVGLAEGDDEATTREHIATALAEFVAGDDERAWVESALLTLLGIGGATGSESLFPAWRTFLERIAERGSAVLVFEDLQWADSGTLEFIEHLLDWSRSHPILVVTLARPELLDSRPGWGTGRSNATAMTLEPMPDTDMRALLAGLLPGLDDEALGTIVRRAEGMPLYAVEMVRALLADGRIERRGDAFAPTGELTDLPLPASLRSLIASRLDALDTDHRAMLQHGSVLGQAFRLDALASVTGSPEADLEPRLRRLVRREFLEIEADPRSPERGQYRFLQSLIREVAYDTLALRERRSRHLAAARHLEAVDSDEAAGALASHYLAAYRASDEGPEAEAVAVQARISLRAAADRAATLGAHAQAVENLEHALGITTDAAERAAILERMTTSAIAAIDPRSTEFAAEAAATYRSLGDYGSAGRANALLAEAYIGVSDIPAALELLERETAAITPGTHPEAEASLFSSLCRAYMRSDRSEESVAAAERSLKLSEALRLDSVTAPTLISKGSALGQLGRVREAVAVIRGGGELAERVGLIGQSLRAAMNLAVTIVDDDPQRAYETTLDNLERARRAGERELADGFAGLACGIGFCIGTPESWATGFAAAADRFELAEHPIARTFLTGSMISQVIARGDDPRDMYAIIERAVDVDPDPTAAIMQPFTDAEIALAAGDHRTALRRARQALEISHLPDNPLATIAAHAASRVGDVESLRWVRDHLAESSQVGTQTEAIRLRVSGALRAMEGDADGALEEFRGALDRYRSMELAWEYARTALDALAALPEDSRVRPWAAEARATFERLGARPYVRLTDEYLGGALPRRPADDRAAVSAEAT